MVFMASFQMFSLHILIYAHCLKNIEMDHTLHADLQFAFSM